MKKKIVLIVLAVLFVPITTYYKESGTTTHTSLTYKIVKWNFEGEHSTYYTNTRIYD